MPDLTAPTDDPARLVRPARPRPDAAWAEAAGDYYVPFTHPAPAPRVVAAAWLAPALTTGLWALFVVDSLARVARRHPSVPEALAVGIVLAATTALCFSSVMYQVGRGAALRRLAGHRRTPREELDRHFRFSHATMTALVPSYAEELKVVRATLWSAALQEFPRLRVVLLIDDPPFPADTEARARLAATRGLPGEIARRLEGPRRFCTAALEGFRAADGPEVTATEVHRLVDTYERAAVWLRDLAADTVIDDHSDGFLVDQVFLGLAEELLADAEQLTTELAAGRCPGAVEMLDRHRRLVRLFSVEAGMFERKRYASLSQAPNKAMNLNSYLGLMGQAWRTVRTEAGDALVPTVDQAVAEVVVPDADYVLTLDADSLLVRDYCVRLVHELEQPGNEDVAVIQTPYCSIPGSPTMVEQVAGATTDLQHLHHLGKTAHDATFWVGANAIIRRRALDEIVTERTERGFRIRTYIQDRTVIEDTESTMDLAARGWRLVNHPERLSYSATPPDFGSLVVQRRRWANGGLIILPKIRDVILCHRVRHRPLDPVGVLLRVDYLGSIAWTCLASLLLLLVPAVGVLVSPLLFLTAVPFLLVQAADLRRVGHGPLDVLWVQALNLVLLPVNLSGVLQSLRQAATGRTVPFARTPKVTARVAAPPTYALAPYLLTVVLAFLAWHSWTLDYRVGTVFALVSTVLMLVGAVTFVGVRGVVQDLAAWARTIGSERAGLLGHRRPRGPLEVARPGALPEPAEVAERRASDQ